MRILYGTSSANSHEARSAYGTLSGALQYSLLSTLQATPREQRLTSVHRVQDQDVDHSVGSAVIDLISISIDESDGVHTVSGPYDYGVGRR